MATYRPREFAAALRRLEKNVLRAQSNGLRRALRQMRKAVIGALPERGLVRAVFANTRDRGRTGLSKLVVVRRVQLAGTTARGTLELRGLAGLQETGGRTKAHTIGPKRGAALRFQGGGRVMFTRRKIQHPGSTVRPFPVVPRLLPEFQRVAAEEIRRDLDALLAKL